MSRIDEAIQKLEAVLDRHICFSRREELEDVLNLLKEEQAPMKTERGARFGVVVHGPEIVDSGNALQLIDYLKKYGTVKAVLGGTMGRVAVMDAGLESVISFSPRRRPSRSIQDLAPDSDAIFLLNQAKSRETGLAFGSMVAAGAGIVKPLIQIDCGGRFVADLSNATVTPDAGGSDEGGLLPKVASDLGLDLLKPPPARAASHLEDAVTIRRTLTGVRPGEVISVNGRVVARATDTLVEIEARGGRIVDIRGATPKGHGLDKLHEVDLEEAIIRSGSIRRSSARAKRGESRGEGAVFIDHCAEDALEAAKGAAVALTVGDDTTAIAGDVLARLGIPVVGIVDGDLDRMAEGMTMMPGSVIIRVEPGYDDIVGRRVHDEVFEGKKRIHIGARDLAERVKKLAGEHLIEIEEIKSDFS
jgi:hypothetical protein